MKKEKYLKNSDYFNAYTPSSPKDDVFQLNQDHVNNSIATLTQADVKEMVKHNKIIECTGHSLVENEESIYNHIGNIELTKLHPKASPYQLPDQHNFNIFNGDSEYNVHHYGHNDFSVVVIKFFCS